MDKKWTPAGNAENKQICGAEAEEWKQMRRKAERSSVLG
jgi:hypothetical protein